MTYRTVEESGVFRKGEEGVFSGDQCILWHRRRIW